MVAVCYQSKRKNNKILDIKIREDKNEDNISRVIKVKQE